MDKYDRAMRMVMKPRTKAAKLFNTERHLKYEREQKERPVVPWYLRDDDWEPVIRLFKD